MATAAEIKADYAARISAADRAGTARRDTAWLDVPHVVAGVPLRAMTMADWMLLRAAGNAHVCADVTCEPPETLERFLVRHDTMLMWVVSPGFCPDAKKRIKFLTDLMAKPWAEVRAGLKAYLDETFAECPRRPKNAPPPQPDPLHVGAPAHWVHALGTAYGWSREQALACPLKQGFQVMRLIRADMRAKAGKETHYLDDEIDHLWSEMLVALNSATA